MGAGTLAPRIRETEGATNAGMASISSPLLHRHGEAAGERIAFRRARMGRWPWSLVGLAAGQPCFLAQDQSHPQRSP